MKPNKRDVKLKAIDFINSQLNFDIGGVKKKNKHHEDLFQIELVGWFGYQFPKYRRQLIAIPNGANLAMKKNSSGGWYCPQAAKLDQMGRCKGASDLFLAQPNKKFSGLWLELKWGKNKATPEQETFMDLMRIVGYAAHITWTMPQAQDIIKFYMGNL